MDAADQSQAAWILLVATKLRVDQIDTEGESPEDVALRYYGHYPGVSPSDAVSLFLAHQAAKKMKRTIVEKDVWISRFVDRLEPIVARPATPAITEFAESAYQLAWDLLPEEVADTYAGALREDGA